MQALTIKDIAKICGVSTSTVSRAINNDPGINANTRERILAVVEEYHFVPNNSARNLKLQESNTVALLIKGIGNRFFQEMYQMFETELRQHGYNFILNEISDRQDDASAAVEIAKEKRLKGIIFLGGLMENPDIRLKRIDIPYVLCTVAVNINAPRYSCSSVAIDDEKEAYKIVDYLCRKGHKRIAIITGRRSDHAVGALRLTGYEKALRDHGIDPDPDLVCYMPEDVPDYTMRAGYEAARELLSRQKDFTALFVISDICAFGAYRAFAEAGVRIPEDCSVAGFDGLDMTKYMVPSLTTVVQPRERLVKASVDLLMREINGQTGNEQLVYDADILEQDSVRDIRN